jgi:hypothetical protein
MQRCLPLGGRFQTLRGKGKERTDVKDDPDDIPMVYLLYVLLAIGALVAGAAIVVSRML